MIPLKNEAAGKRIPIMTVGIILSCIIMFVYQVASNTTIGVVPVDLMHSIFNPGLDIFDKEKTVLMSFFMHGGVVHLISNMWYLWIFGAAVEMRIGKTTMSIIYLCCGIISIVVQVGSAPLSTIPIIGASGAIAGIMGVHLMILPMAKVVVWLPPIFLFRLPAFIFLLFWFGLQYINITSSTGNNGGIAWWAHVGGYMAGVLLTLLLRNRMKPGKR